MKTFKTMIALLSCSVLLCSCNSVDNTTTTLDDDLTTIGDTSSSNDTSSTTSNKVETSSNSSTVDISSTSTDDTTSVDTSSTSIDSTTSKTTGDTTSLDTTSDTQTSETTEYVPVTYDELIIPITPTSEYITKDMCKEIAEYFNSMINIDVDTFNSKQLSAYNSFMEEYLTQNESSLSEMLATYCDNFLKSSGDEEAGYTDFTIDSIRLDYPNDMESILNTMDYINQLDDVTDQYENYTLSDELTAYYQLTYSMDYTLTGDGLENFDGIRNGSILVLDIDGKISVIMLY